MRRDFSEESKQKMLSLVSQVENEKWGNFTDWIGDRWYDFESWIGILDIKNYINDVNLYHKKVIDKNSATEKTINDIFCAVRNIDVSYSTTIRNIRVNLSQWLRYIDQLATIVTPSNGYFSTEFMTIMLADTLEDISNSNVQRVVDRLVEDIDGELIFDKDLLFEYIKKNPAEITDDEIKAILAVIERLQDTVVMYESAASCGNDELGADFWNQAAWISNTTKYESFSAISAHYNELYVSLLNVCVEEGKDSNTFAAALLKASNGENVLSVLGIDISDEVSKIFGTLSISAYTAKWEDEHSEQYFLKLSANESTKLEIKNDVDSFNEWVEQKLKEGDHYIEEKDEFYLDKDGNEIKRTDGAPIFYDKELSLGEIGQDVGVSASIYDGSFDVGENGKLSVTVGEAEAHAGISAGFYVIGADGEKKFSPGVNAEIGASVTAFESEWEQQWLGNENVGLNTEVGVTTGKAEAKADVGAQIFGEDGRLDVQLGASASAEAIAAEANASVGVNVLGGEVGVEGGVNVGIGAHADVGYRDGVVKCDVGASLGVGVSLDVEIDVGGMVDGVCDVAEGAMNYVEEGWNDFVEGWNDFWDW